MRPVWLPCPQNITFTSFRSNGPVQVQKSTIRSCPFRPPLRPPGHLEKRRDQDTEREWGDEGYGGKDHSVAKGGMGADKLPPGTGTEPGYGMSWDDDAVKSLQAGRLQLAQAFQLVCDLDRSLKGRGSRNTPTAGPTPTRRCSLRIADPDSAFAVLQLS